jgi:diguanylate cyclase (GGDEF)-like protein
MMSQAEELISPKGAAEQALRLLARMSPLSAAAVWVRSGTVWRRLAAIGDALSLDAPDTPPAGSNDHAESLPLVSGDDTLGWIAWRGASFACVEDVTRLLTGQLVAARLADEQSRSRVTQETLLEISQLAGECLSIEDFFSQVHHLLSRLMDVDNFYIALSDESTNSLRIPFFRDSRLCVLPGPAPLAPMTDEGQIGLVCRVLSQGEPLLLEGDAVQKALGQEEPVPVSWVGVPLVASTGASVGVVVLQRYPEQEAFSGADRRMFQFAVRHIGSALDRLLYHSRLEKQVWLRTCELEGANSRLVAEASKRQRAEKFQLVLYRIAELSNSSLSLNAFLGGLHRLLAEMVPAQNCLVAFYDQQSDTIRFPYCIDEHYIQVKAHKPGKGLIEQVLHSGQPLLLNEVDYRQDAEDEGAVRPTSWLGVPLYCSHELMGVLAVQSYQPGMAYTYRDQEVLEYVANNIGTALARVRALEDLQRAYGELEERVRERTCELDAVNAQLQFDSMHDTLTKLPNRSYFAKTLRRTWEAYVGGVGERFAVCFIDLDRFKLVNDTLGHLAGDHLLFEAGARIRSCLRHYDFMARLGGDEFAVLLFGMDQVEGSEQIARRMVSEFERPIILAGREVFTTASVGVVLADRQYYQNADELLRDADHAMYRTKQQGRHGYTLFSHELRANQADQLAMETELRRALDESNQLIPYYQPFIDARNGELVGFETLVRWQHPTRGLVSPALFLPMAEESGLIMRLDRYMISAACAQLREWQDLGVVHEGITLHINLSSANFHDPELVPWMAEIIERYRLPPSMLYLEITESALIDVPDIAATVMHALHGLGIRLALDDFGTGYSALSYLHRYRFDVLKIDQSFVFDVHRKEESAAIVRAILALAQALSLDVVAEGVETSDQLRHLRAMGCAKLQGYYFSRPTPACLVDWARLKGFVHEFGHAQ